MSRLLRPRLVSSLLASTTTTTTTITTANTLRHTPTLLPLRRLNPIANNPNPTLPIQARKMSGLTAVLSHDAAPPAGPYSQAIKANGLVFVSGQIPADNKGNVIEGDIETCTKASLENLSAVLTAAGTTLDKVVKTTVFLADMGDFARVNSVYEQYFTGPTKPARSCVAVKTLPKNVRVEVECIALQ